MAEPTKFRPPSVATARQLGQESVARQLVIVAIGEDGTYAITTWGKTRRECRGLARWSESDLAAMLVADLAEIADG